MTELQAGEAPSENVWKRIRLELDRERDSRAVEAQRSAPVRRWRAFAMAGAFATVAAVAISVTTVLNMRATPEIRYVAMLADDKSAPGMLVTFDPRHNTLTLKRLAGSPEGAEKSLQLWALPPGSGPRSLGVLPQGAVVRLTAAESQVQVPALAISLEPKGGVPAGSGPTGPVLWKGAVVPTS
jgi:anti-sigma-K factor RskA